MLLPALLKRRPTPHAPPRLCSFTLVLQCTVMKLRLRFLQTPLTPTLLRLTQSYGGGRQVSSLILVVGFLFAVTLLQYWPSAS